MKEEYIEIIIYMLVMLGFFALIHLIGDLFQDGIFFICMPIILIMWAILFGITLIIKAFQLNYKIIKRK